MKAVEKVGQMLVEGQLKFGSGSGDGVGVGFGNWVLWPLILLVVSV